MGLEAEWLQEKWTGKAIPDLVCDDPTIVSVAVAIIIIVIIIKKKVMSWQNCYHAA